MVDFQGMDLPGSVQTSVHKMPTQLCKSKEFRHFYLQIRIRMRLFFYLHAAA